MNSPIPCSTSFCRNSLIGVLMLLAIFSTNRATAQRLGTHEAEDCQIKCAAGSAPGETMWASGGKVTPPFWGREPGDRIEWSINLAAPISDLKLAIRYSYAAGHYRGYSGTENPERMLDFVIDHGEPQKLHVPDTGWWDWFETLDLDLPALPPGQHTFEIRSTIPHTVTNFDCFTLYKGPLETLPPAFRQMRVAKSSSGHFVLQVTSGVKLTLPPETIFQNFDRIYDYYKDYMGWEPPTPVGIHIIEDKKWPNPGASSYQNQDGVFFRESAMATDRGNWCHEMTHMFYVAHFPWWFDEASVQTLTTFDWVPALFPQHARPEDDPYYRQCADAGREMLSSPSKLCDDVFPVLYAIRVKYGPEVFRKFFHACAQAGEKGELDFTPGHHLKRDQIVHYLSVAAGEDLAPLFHRWRGFGGAE